METQSLPQAPVRPPPRPQQFQQQPQRPLQRPPPRRPGGPRGPPRRRPPTRRPGRPTTTSKGILAGAVDAVSSAVGGVACTGSNIITDAKLRDEAFIKFQLDCAMNVGPCDEIGEKIKSKLPNKLTHSELTLYSQSWRPRCWQADVLDLATSAPRPRSSG